MACDGIESWGFTKRIEIFFFQAGRFHVAVGAKVKFLRKTQDINFYSRLTFEEQGDI